MFKSYDGREQFYQWDLNRKLIVIDNTVDTVHFTNYNSKEALVCGVYKDENGVRVVDVPNILLQEAWDIKAYGFCGGCYTKVFHTYKVEPRLKPASYIYEETQVLNWDLLKADLVDLENVVDEFKTDNASEHKTINDSIAANAAEATEEINDVKDRVAVLETDNTVNKFNISNLDNRIIEVKDRTSALNVAVNNLTDTTEKKYNKVTAIGSNANDTQYPTAKAVKDYVDSKPTGGGGSVNLNSVPQYYLSINDMYNNTLIVGEPKFLKAVIGNEVLTIADEEILANEGTYMLEDATHPLLTSDYKNLWGEVNDDGYGNGKKLASILQKVENVDIGFGFAFDGYIGDAACIMLGTINLETFEYIPNSGITILANSGCKIFELKEYEEVTIPQPFVYGDGNGNIVYCTAFVKNHEEVFPEVNPTVQIGDDEYYEFNYTGDYSGSSGWLFVAKNMDTSYVFRDFELVNMGTAFSEYQGIVENNKILFAFKQENNSESLTVRINRELFESNFEWQLLIVWSKFITKVM